MSPKTTQSPPLPRRRSSSRRRSNRRQRQRRRQSRHIFDFRGYDDWFDYSNYDYSEPTDESTAQQDRGIPAQNVYFFKKGENIFRSQAHKSTTMTTFHFSFLL